MCDVNSNITETKTVWHGKHKTGKTSITQNSLIFIAILQSEWSKKTI